MAYEHSLLERIADPEKANSHDLVIDESAVIDSVMVHINNMLNVRKGSVETLLDYGLPDFNDLQSELPQIVHGIRKAIKYCIETYEPRLRNVKVTYVEEPGTRLHLRFDITAELIIENKKTGIWFETILDSAGRARVKR